jgi:hypothetical protein
MVEHEVLSHQKTRLRPGCAAARPNNENAMNNNNILSPTHGARTFFHLSGPLATIACSIALLHLANSAAAADVFHYSLVNDWSDVQNPNGAWSYNLNNSPITTHQTFWWGQAGWGYLDFSDGGIIKGSYPANMNDPWGDPTGTAHDWQDGDVAMHALSIPYGGDTTFLNVKWTSPADGTIDITGRAWDAKVFPERVVAWLLIVGGQTIAERSSVYGLYRTDAGAQFESNLIGNSQLTGIPVVQGQTVEFRVVALSYYGHYVGVQEDITLTVIPEPGTGSLLLAGLIVVWRTRRRFS